MENGEARDAQEVFLRALGDLDEHLAYAYGLHTAMLQTITTAINQKFLSSRDAISLLAVADRARLLMDGARIAIDGDDIYQDSTVKVHSSFVVWGEQAKESKKTRNPVGIERPPSLWYNGLLMRILTPRMYARYVAPHVADLQHEYFQCISKGDESGARWAVIRANFYAIPTWAWTLITGLVAKLIDFIRT